MVHHVNGIRTDNRLVNLELWNRSHPKGQRIDDEQRHAEDLLRPLRPSLLIDAIRHGDAPGEPPGHR